MQFCTKCAVLITTCAVLTAPLSEQRSPGLVAGFCGGQERGNTERKGKGEKSDRGKRKREGEESGKGQKKEKKGEGRGDGNGGISCSCDFSLGESLVLKACSTNQSVNHLLAV